MFEFALPGASIRAAILTAALVAQPAAAQSAPAEGLAQAFPAEGCLARRDAIAAVASGRVVPLRQVRGVAEDAAHGEMINAELCSKNGTAVYVVTVLSTSGKVVYVTLNAVSGQLMNLR